MMAIGGVTFFIIIAVIGTLVWVATTSFGTARITTIETKRDSDDDAKDGDDA